LEGTTTIPPEPPTKAPDISIYHAAKDGRIEDVKKALDASMDVNAKRLEWK